MILLIDQIKENYECLQSGVKKTAYQNIANVLNNRFKLNISYEQVDSKWKGLKRTYKKIKEDNNTTGQSRKTWEYYDLIDSILFRAPEINPSAVLSTEDMEVFCTPAKFPNSTEIDSSPSSAYRTNLSRKRKVDDQEGVERRHKERMEATNKFLQIFQQMVDKM